MDSRGKRIRLLEADPDLGADLQGQELAEATARLVVPLERVDPGHWDPSGAFPHPTGALGMLVHGGLLTVFTALVTRAGARAQGLAVSLAISCVVALPLTHQIVVRLVGASRPSVSTALKQLEDEGAISRLPDGGFRLHSEPPEVVKLVSDRREATRMAARS